MITKTFLETGHLMYIMTNIYSGKVRGVCLHNMKLGKGIESHRENLSFGIQTENYFLNPTPSSLPLQHHGEQRTVNPMAPTTGKLVLLLRRCVALSG